MRDARWQNKVTFNYLTLIFCSDNSQCEGSGVKYLNRYKTPKGQHSIQHFNDHLYFIAMFGKSLDCLCTVTTDVLTVDLLATALTRTGSINS